MLAWCSQAARAAAPPVRVVVSFSILEDIVRRIGGGEIAVTSLIGPDSDAHVFEPNPDQARLLAKAQLFVANGLGFEGWLTRSAQFAGAVVTVTYGVAPITTTEPGETSPVPDPHAWQDPRNGIVYADDIARALATIYSDALSRPSGPAPTYIRMIEYDTAALKSGTLKN
jgi:zinc/manganese transport system substrate-binding protein